MRTVYFSSVLLSILLVTSLIVPLLLVSLSSQPVSASPGPGSKFNPTDDAEVVRGNPDTNYGASARVGIRSKNVSAYDIRGFLKFDISSLPPNTTIDSATLRIYQYYIGGYIAGVNDAEVREVSDDTWDESLVTWNTQPAMGNLIGTVVTAAPINVWRELDVTSYVQSEFNCGAGDNLISFGLKCVTENYDGTDRNAYFRSKEATDNFPELVVEYHFEKKCMPDLGQHSASWCWAAAAANSIYWWSQHGYPQLIDDPADPTPNDNRYITDMIPHPPPPVPPCFIYRLLHEIAIDCLYPGVPENMLIIDNTYCQPIFDDQYFFGLQEFINEQGAPLIVHEIVDNNLVFRPPPQIDNIVIYRPPTLEDYQRELERCQDVLLWLNYRHENYENYYKNEETDHVVTGVGFSYDNTWILVSDPWTTGAPDHGNDLYHAPENRPYENLQVLDNDPLWVLYEGMPVQVTKMVYISPEEEYCGVEVTIDPEYQEGIPCENLYFNVTVHNTGNVVDNFLLSYIPNGWPDIWIIPELLENISPCENKMATLIVHIPENAEICTEKEIVVRAESAFCHAVDNDNCIAHVVEYQRKENMPDLGQHCINWCWAAAAANSIKWWAEYRGYIELLDDPSDNVLDENYLQLLPGVCPWGPVLRLLVEIAKDCLFPGVPENEIPDNLTWCSSVFNAQYFYGLQEFIREQGAPLYVHEIIDNDHFAGHPEPIPPEDGENVIYDQPTFENYKREIRRCQDVLLQLDFRNSGYESDPPGQEALDHIVTGVSFYDGGPGNQWIEVADPWTPFPWPGPVGGPDHNNDQTRYTYENLPVLSVDPLVVLYTGENNGVPVTQPVQVVKLIYISPIVTPWTGSAAFRLENLYKVNMYKDDLWLYQGSKLVVKFYTYDNIYEDENVIHVFVPPWQVVPENENVPHPSGIGVKKAKLWLVDDVGDEISKIKGWVTIRSDLWTRIGEIRLLWPYATPAERSALWSELGGIRLQWPYAPSTRDPIWVDP